jgi:hypothetical protein
MVKYSFRSLLGVLICLSWLGFGLTPPSCQKGEDFEFTGKVHTLDSGTQSFEIIALDGSVVPIVTDENTSYTGAATIAGFSGLVKDLRVLVSGTKSPDGIYTAAEVYLFPITFVSGTLDIQSIPGINSWRDVGIKVSGVDGSSFVTDLSYEDGTFNIEIRIVPELQVTLTFINKNTEATVAVLVFDVNASGVQDLLFPVTTQSGLALVITLGVVSVPPAPPMLNGSGPIAPPTSFAVLLSPQNNPSEQVDYDGDKKSDYDDSDDDNNSVPDADDDKDKAQNPDSDLYPSDIDDDDDNDSISDKSDTDANGNGVDDLKERDSDGDGIADEKDADLDNDGLNNDVDDDDNNNGIKDVDEVDTDKDGIPDYMDDDIDGDGKKNKDDDDVDGDGVKNGDDSDSCEVKCDQFDQGNLTSDEIAPCICTVSDTIISGAIQEIVAPEYAFLINGIKVFTNKNTRYSGNLTGFKDLVVGLTVEVKAGKLSDGSVIAYEVKGKKPNDPITFKTSGHVTSINAEKGFFTLDSLSSDLGELPIFVDGQTSYKGLNSFKDIATGQYLLVKGVYTDHYLASYVELQKDPGGNTQTFKATGYILEIDSKAQAIFVALTSLSIQKGLWIAVNGNTVYDGVTGFGDLKLDQDLEIRGLIILDQSGPSPVETYLAQYIKVNKPTEPFKAEGKVLEVDPKLLTFWLESSGVKLLITTDGQTQYNNLPNGIGSIMLGDWLIVEGTIVVAPEGKSYLAQRVTLKKP